MTPLSCHILLRLGVCILMVVFMVVLGGATRCWAQSERRVLLVTAPPYAGVSVLRDALLDAGVDVETISLQGDFLKSVRHLQERDISSPIDVVAVGGASLVVRWWFEKSATEVPVGHFVMVAPPNGGSVTAGMLYTQILGADVQRYRLEREMYRVEEGPWWSRPQYGSVQSYLAERTRYLYEPLYGRFLVREHMSLIPAPLERSSDFLSWLTDNYSSVCNYLTDSETPLERPVDSEEPKIGEVGQMLTWGYLDLMASQIARRTYFTTVPAGSVLTDGMARDVTLGQDIKTSILEFARRRLFHFAENYIMPHLLGAGRDIAAGWLTEQFCLSREVLMYQLPERVRVPVRGETLAVEGNRLLADMNAGGRASHHRISVIAVRSPNWWQLLDPLVGPNDWWTEVDATCHPGGCDWMQEVFSPVGGRVDDDAVVASVLESLGLQGSAPSPPLLRGIMTVVGRVADTVMGIVGRLRDSIPRGFSPATQKQARIVDAHSGDPRDSGLHTEEDVPEIRAIYRNKSTTLKDDRLLDHQYWVWDFGDGHVSVDDAPDNTVGQVSHTYAAPGEYMVSGTSMACDGSVVRHQEWEVEAEDSGWTEAFAYETAERVVPRVVLSGPVSWLTGKPARYNVEVALDVLPEEVANLRVVVYPGEEFDVVWERPGIFEVKAAVNLRYSWRFDDGSSRFFSVTFTETVSVEVFATTVR